MDRLPMPPMIGLSPMPQSCQPVGRDSATADAVRFAGQSVERDLAPTGERPAAQPRIDR
jgi:hypothetical protein